jgi:lipopolysaccharide export system protein LptC
MNRVITARTDAQTARAYWTTSRGDSERAFRAARRHSRVVRALRIAIPAFVGVVVVVVVLATYFNPLRMLSKLPVNVGDLVISGSKITMESPRLSGFTRDARAYELTADAAAQDLTKPDIIELHNIHAKVQMQDKSTVRLSALKGIYDSKGETLKLDRDIVLNSTSGYEGRLSEATVDIRKGNVLSEHPVELEMLQGTLNANRLQIFDSGDRILFDNGVRMTLILTEEAAQRLKQNRAPSAGADNPPVAPARGGRRP